MPKKCKIIQPEYVKYFKCSANNCENDTCCSGWMIYVDKNAYDKCKNIKETEIRKKIDQALLITKNNSSIRNYAYIKFNKSGLCPLLTDDGLCSLHLKYGEEYLGEVCNLYPRIICKLNGSYIQSLSMGCIEAAKLCLLNPEGINFEMIEVNHQEKFDVSAPIFTDNYENQEFINIQICIIMMLQNKTINFTERLLVLGYFLSELEQILFSKRYGEIGNLVYKYQSSNYGIFETSNLQNKQEIKIRIIFDIIDKRINKGINNKTFYGFLESFHKGFILEEEMDLYDLINKYKDGYSKLRKNIFDEYQYIWENYFVNTIFREVIPLNAGGYKVTKSYFVLALQYALLECFLVGIINYNENLTTEDIVKFIASFERVFPYNYLDKCYDDLSVELKDNFEFYKALL